MCLDVKLNGCLIKRIKKKTKQAKACCDKFSMQHAISEIISKEFHERNFELYELHFRI